MATVAVRSTARHVLPRVAPTLWATSSSCRGFASATSAPAQSKKPLRMLIMGSPGSGKGTQTERMMKHFEMEAISSGDLLRKHIKAGTEIGTVAAKIIAEGGLVPDGVMVNLMTEELQKLKDKTLLLDGFPRTLPQAEALDVALASNKMPLDLVINLDVPPEVILQRIEDRWVHIPSGRVYNLSYNPPKVAGKDDVTGEPLSKRPDDNVETFKKRLDNYFSMTKPLISYYENQGKLRSFHGETSDIIAPQIKEELAKWYAKQ
ncbi:putative adenylate kinase 3 [Gonapodya prolifera JEL478]|uniref:GTP:AMP phosphotransferase, mitochondrial n=1 Tax=Gonapodya prolifera (strain JEL478) TaxID=1344416 RepID=A0A139B0C8_GONPJ|nr:putative adenylate kinase 3 [Gonapodya prolifera JEL478]|eukprot:KXS22452.1 putative adenylate kinase 3 [Gonapodya prolifera JEL478]